ncbi:hypothetical protein BH23CHL2_BH23CHL2_28910 [soil metagenome]
MQRTILVALLALLIAPASVAAQTSDNDLDKEEVLVRINGSDIVGAEERVSVAVIVSGDLEIAGKVTGTAVVVDGDMAVLNGARVEGTLIIVAGRLTMRDGSVVSGNVYLSDDGSWVMEEGATFTGEVRQGSFSPRLEREAAWQIVIGTLASWLGLTLLAVVGATIFAGIGGRQLWSSAANLTSRPGATILATVLFWLGLLLITALFTLSFIGILALPAVFIFGTVIWILGYIAFATRLGALITGQRMDDAGISHPYLAAIAGTVVLQIALLVAVGGALGALLAVLLSDSAGGMALALAILASVFYVILWIAGLLGGGAVTLRALSAWSSRT